MSDARAHVTPPFSGAAAIVELVRQLVRRPRFGEAPGATDGRRRWGRRNRWGVPMLCLVRDDTAEALLPSLRDRFQAAQPRRIPAVYYDFAHPPPSRAVDAGGPADDVDRIGEALLWISSQLSAGPNSAAGRIRFRKLGLVLALLAMDLSDRGADSDVVLRDRQLDRGPFLGEPLPQIVEPALPNWVTAILRLFPPVWFTARISGRIP